jgi:hypothetical protein
VGKREEQQQEEAVEEEKKAGPLGAVEEEEKDRRAPHRLVVLVLDGRTNASPRYVTARLGADNDVYFVRPTTHTDESGRFVLPFCVGALEMSLEHLD